MQYLITPLLEVLNPTNTVSRNRLLSFAIGNMEAEIYNCLIAKHVYYNNQGKLHEGGWFYSTVKDLHLSTPVSDRDSCNSTEENMSEAVTNLHFSAGVDDSDSVRVIGNSGDICSETDFCAQKPCSVGYGGTSSPAAPRETKDNKKQSDFFINPSFLPSAPEENFSEDGIEGQAAVKELSFLEILAAMGLDLEDWYFFYSRNPTSEKDLLCVDEVNRRTKTLHIPEDLRRDKNAVMIALRFLAAYGNYAYDDDVKPTSIKPFLDITLNMLCDMIMADSFTHNGRTVGYSEVLETMNELIREDYLYDFILNFQAEWNKILREDSAKGNQIRNSSAYMKSCLWDWLKRWKIEEYNLLVSLE